MKNLKFLFVTIILACLIGVTEVNAQALVVRDSQYKDVYYEIDGTQYGAYAFVEYQFVITPSGNFKWVAKGEIVEAYEWDPAIGWIPLDYIPLPNKTVIYYDPAWNNEKVTITPSGNVTVVVLVKDAPWL